MEGFKEWLKKEPSAFQMAGFIFLMCWVNIISSIVMVWVLNITHARLEEHAPLGIPLISIKFAGMLIIVAIFEELIFRVPLVLVLEKKRFKQIHLVSAVLFSSVIFGYLHGNVYNIFLQGFGGIWLCIVFLKCGGMNGKYFKGYCSSVSCHFVYNIIVFCILFYRGGRTF